ncbi:hypothetical protein ACE7GA_09380 [Roseomonas sp. CCTCC AB2023176]|uniref:hypothetical protein n=1 Tax=Roseomonas sp. CCTCC AB2023176 TaxID=3342640 RepID=UPI0035DD4153
MNKSIVLDTHHAFRADTAEANRTAMNRSSNGDASPQGGVFTQEELRDLVLHWMG